MNDDQRKTAGVVQTPEAANVLPFENEAWYTDGYPRAAEHQRQISPRGWRAPRAELLMRARGGRLLPY